MEKDVMKCEKIKLQGRSIRFNFVAVRVDENPAILEQPDTFDIKYFEFLY